MSRAPRIVGIAAGIGLMAGLAACGGGGGAADTGGSSAAAGSSTATAADSAGGSPASSAQQGNGIQELVTAGQTAVQKVGKGTVSSIETEDDGTHWEVKVVTSDGTAYEVVTSRDGGKVVSGPRAKDSDAEDKAEDKKEIDGAKLDYEAAAMKIYDARNGTITELGLDDHHGAIVWEADVHTGGTKYEVRINAASGAVLKNKADS